MPAMRKPVDIRARIAAGKSVLPPTVGEISTGIGSAVFFLVALIGTLVIVGYFLVSLFA